MQEDEKTTVTSFKTGIDETEEVEGFVSSKIDFLRDVSFFLQFDPPSAIYMLYAILWILWSFIPIVDPNEFWGGAVHFWEKMAFFKIYFFRAFTYDTNMVFTFIILIFQIGIILLVYITYSLKKNGSSLGEYLKFFLLLVLCIFIFCSFEIIAMQVGITSCSSFDFASGTATYVSYPDVYCYTPENIVKTLISFVVIALTFVIIFFATSFIFSNNPKKGFSSTSSLPFLCLAVNSVFNQLIVESLSDASRILAPLIFAILNLMCALYVAIFAPFYCIEANTIFTAQFLAKSGVSAVTFLCYSINALFYYVFPAIYEQAWFPWVGVGFTVLWFIVLALSLILGAIATQVYQRIYFAWGFHSFAKMCDEIDPEKLEALNQGNREDANTFKEKYTKTVEKCKKKIKSKFWMTKSIQLCCGEFVLRRMCHHDLEKVIKVLDDPLKGNLSCEAYCSIALYLMLFKKQPVTPLYYLNKAKKKARGFLQRSSIQEFQMIYETLNDDGGGSHEVRKILKDAKKLEEEHNTLVESFFRCLRDDKGLAKRFRLLNMVAEISGIKQNLRHIYDNLMSKYHRMPNVLRQYSEYLRDIEFQEERAIELSAKAQEYEEERASEKKSRFGHVDERRMKKFAEMKKHQASVLIKSGTFLFTKVKTMLSGSKNKIDPNQNDKGFSPIPLDNEGKEQKDGKKLPFPDELQQRRSRQYNPTAAQMLSPFSDESPAEGALYKEENEKNKSKRKNPKGKVKLADGSSGEDSSENDTNNESPSQHMKTPPNKFILAKRKSASGSTETPDSDNDDSAANDNQKSSGPSELVPVSQPQAQLPVAPKKKLSEDLLHLDVLGGPLLEEEEDSDDDEPEDRTSQFSKFRDAIRSRFSDKFFFLIAALFGLVTYIIMLVGGAMMIFLSMGSISEYKDFPTICRAPRIVHDVTSTFRVMQREMKYNSSANYNNYLENNMKLVPYLKQIVNLVTINTNSFQYRSDALIGTSDTFANTIQYKYPIVSVNGTKYGTKDQETNFLGLALAYVNNVKHLLYVAPSDILTGSTETYFLEYNSGTVADLFSKLCDGYSDYYYNESVGHTTFLWLIWGACVAIILGLTIAVQVYFCYWSSKRSQTNAVFLSLNHDVLHEVCEEMKDRNRFIKNQKLSKTSAIGLAMCTRVASCCLFAVVLLFAFSILTLVLGLGTAAFNDKGVEAQIYKYYGDYTSSVADLMDSYESYLMELKLQSSQYANIVLTNTTKSDLMAKVSKVTTTYNDFIFGHTNLHEDSRLNKLIHNTYDQTCVDRFCWGVAYLNLVLLRVADDIAQTVGLTIPQMDAKYTILRAYYSSLQTRVDQVITAYGNFQEYAKYARILIFVLAGESVWVCILEFFLLYLLNTFSNQLHSMKFLLNYLPFDVLEDNLMIKEYLNSGNVLNHEKSLQRVDKTQAIIDASESAIFITNENMGIKILNKTAKEMFQLSSQSEAFGVVIGNFFHSSHKKEIKKIYKRLFKSISDTPDGTNELNSEVIEIAGLKRFKNEKQFPTFVQFATTYWGKKKIMVVFVRDTSDDKKRKHLFEEEKRKSEKLLLNVLPAEVAKRIQKGEKLISFAHKDVTILFSDIQGFTKMSSTLNPTELVEYLNGVVNSFDDLAMKHQLEKIKTIGDAYFVTGGLYDGTDDHPLRVVLMGLDMLIAIKQLSEFNVNIRIGISTGPCISGVVGVTKFGFDLYGETVDIAQLMESGGVAGKVHISESTQKRVLPYFKFTERNEVVYKTQAAFACGTDTTMKTFLVEGLADEVLKKQSKDIYDDMNEY